eukprot:scaffold1390_cov249-Pinguiococcus_pyrenoidosus.AAC.12
MAVRIVAPLNEVPVAPLPRVAAGCRTPVLRSDRAALRLRKPRTIFCSIAEALGVPDRKRDVPTVRGRQHRLRASGRRESPRKAARPRHRP